MSEDIVTRMRQLAGAMSEARFPALEATAIEAADEIERLRTERDEARRRVCSDAIQYGRVYRRVDSRTVQLSTPQQVAKMMGWLCFEEAADAL